MIRGNREISGLANCSSLTRVQYSHRSTNFIGGVGHLFFFMSAATHLTSNKCRTRLSIAQEDFVSSSSLELFIPFIKAWNSIRFCHSFMGWLPIWCPTSNDTCLTKLKQLIHMSSRTKFWLMLIVATCVRLYGAWSSEMYRGSSSAVSLRGVKGEQCLLVWGPGVEHPSRIFFIGGKFCNFHMVSYVNPN